MHLILGANGYLGQHLAWRMRNDDCVLHSFSGPSERCRLTGLPFLQEDLIRGCCELEKLTPSRVYLFARPVSDEAWVHMRFLNNLERLLRLWADAGCLEEIVFTSTQLVYQTPDGSTPLKIDAPLGPQTPYDCHKLQLEGFLRLLSHHPSIRSIHVYRLPLVAGLPCSSEQEAMQFLFHWRSAYRLGFRWSFPEELEVRAWGNSWVHMEDLYEIMGEKLRDSPSTFNLWHPCSGHVSYWDLHEQFVRCFGEVETSGGIHLPRTSFYLEDNTGIRPKSLNEIYPVEADMTP